MVIVPFVVLLKRTLWYNVNMRIATLNRFIDDWIVDYRNGLSVRRIATKYGVSKSTVQKYLAQNIDLRHKDETQLGKNNSNWQGDRVSLWGLHKWLRGAKPKPELCEKCELKPPLDLANISPIYNKKTYTRDFKNWLWLCRSCHMKADGRLDRLHKRNVKKLLTHCK